MSNKKLTKRDHFNALLALSEVKSNPVLTDFINHELELLAKKNAADKKPTAQQIANEGVKSAIIEALSEKPVTITDLIKSAPALSDLTNQRVSALVRQLVDEGKVVRVEDKRKAFFHLAPVVSE